MSETNRFILVDETGRVYDRTGVSIELSKQDGGLTLKAFLKPTTESAEANARHLARLSEDLKRDRKEYNVAIANGLMGQARVIGRRTE